MEVVRSTSLPPKSIDPRHRAGEQRQAYLRQSKLLERMTHEERRERRKAIASAIEQGVPVARVCQQFGITDATARIALEEFGGGSHRIRRLAKRKQLLSLAKKFPLREAAKRAGVSCKAAREYCRIAHIKPTYPYGRKRASWESLDWTLRNADLAKVLGVTGERIRQIRKMLGKKQSAYYRQHLSSM